MTDIAVDILQRDYLEGRMEPLPKRVRLAISDPPYNQGMEYADDPTGDQLPDAIYDSLIRRASSFGLDSLVPGGVMFWLCPANDLFRVHNLIMGHGGCHLLWGTPIVWHESFAQYQQKRMTCDYRVWLPIVKNGGEPVFNPDAIRVESERQRMGDKRANPNGRVPGRVWSIRRLQGTSKAWKPWHPCQLAPEMLDRIILGFSNPGDTVVDLFAGSGSAGRRAVAHGRSFVGIDRSGEYCERMRAEVGGEVAA